LFASSARHPEKSNDPNNKEESSVALFDLAVRNGAIVGGTPDLSLSVICATFWTGLSTMRIGSGNLAGISRIFGDEWYMA
jgi:hypothetical protein